MPGVVVDAGTVGAVDRLLGASDRLDEGEFIDLDIAALSTVVDALVWFDQVFVPDLGHQRALQPVVRRLGDLVSVVEVPAGTGATILQEARGWTKAWPHVENFIELLGAVPAYRNAQGPSGSDSHLIRSVLSVPPPNGSSPEEA